MKGKLLIQFLILLILSSTTFATEYNNARIIEHKEGTKGKVRAFFKPLKIEKSIIDKQRSANGESYTAVGSTAFPTQGKIGKEVAIHGYHFVAIANETQDIQRYTYTYQVCARDSEHSSKCANYFDAIELNPGGKIINSKKVELWIKFNNADEYLVEVSTSLMKEIASNTWVQVSNSQSESTAVIKDFPFSGIYNKCNIKQL